MQRSVYPGCQGVGRQAFASSVVLELAQRDGEGDCRMTTWTGERADEQAGKWAGSGQMEL